MIRINLLPKTERVRRAVPAARSEISTGSRILVALLILSVLGWGGWWVYSQGRLTVLRREVSALVAEEARLGTLVVERTLFERTKQDLQRRLGIIGRLERTQGVPVVLLEGIVRSVPKGVWLSALDVTPVVTKREEKIAPPAPGLLQRLEGARTGQPGPAFPQEAGQAEKGKETRTVTEVTGYRVTVKGLAMSNLMVADLLDNLRRVPTFKDVDLSVIERAEVEKVRVMSFTATWGIPL